MVEAVFDVDGLRTVENTVLLKVLAVEHQRSAIFLGVTRFLIWLLLFLGRELTLALGLVIGKGLTLLDAVLTDAHLVRHFLNAGANGFIRKFWKAWTAI